MANAAIFQGTAALQHEETVRNALITLARASREQPGTLRYEFYELKDEPLKFMLFAM